MKTKTTSSRNAAPPAPRSCDPIAAYVAAQTPECAGICRALRIEIDACLPEASAKMWHAIPVWFIGENPVVGFNATAGRANLLFWNGQAFDEPRLKAVGKFRAAQIQFEGAAQIDPEALRRWLKKAGKHIWDYRGLCRPPKP